MNRKEFYILIIIFKLAVISLMVMIAWKDWKIKRIPDFYILSVFVAGIMEMCLGAGVGLTQRTVGFFVVSIPMFIIACVMPGSIGGGDIKLMAAAGFLLGSAKIWNAFVTGIICAGICVLGLLLMKKADRKTEIALGPFFSIGIILHFL